MGNYTIFQIFENPRRGRQARNFTTNVPKVLDLKSFSEQIFSRKLTLGAPEACIDHADHIFCIGVQTLESVLDDCLAQFSSKQVLKKEQRQAVLGLLEQKPDWLLPFYHDFWENFNLPLVRGSETQTKRKECSISCIAIADVINDQVEAMDFKTILYQNINYLLNCNYQLSTLCRVIRFLLHLPLVFL